MRFCGACGAPLEAPQEIAEPGAGAQRRHVTVMFCDLVESTPIAGALDPEDYRDILRAYHRACSSAIERYDGYTAQYLGDGLIAYFGYPRAHEDNAARGIHAGLEILDEIAALSERQHDLHGVALQVRIGLHTGVVVAGEMGAGETRDPRAIVGETPHIAARLQSIAPVGSLVVSGATHDLVEGYFEAESLVER
jgi:class 3 adenylate cyclase